MNDNSYVKYMGQNNGVLENVCCTEKRQTLTDYLLYHTLVVMLFIQIFNLVVKCVYRQFILLIFFLMHVHNVSFITLSYRVLNKWCI